MNLKKIMAIILVIIWMITVFGFSNDKGEKSSSKSRKVATQIVQIIDIKDNLQDEDKKTLVQKIEPIIRKLAHYSIYTLGGFLIINCIYIFIDIEKRAIVCSLILGIIYASTDEIHQLFTAGRSGKITDVIIDSLGILTGIAIYLLVRKIIEKLIKRTSKET